MVIRDLDLSTAPDPVPMPMALELLCTSRRTLVNAATELGIPLVRVGGGLKQRRWALHQDDVRRLFQLLHSPVAAEVGPEAGA